MGKKQKGILVKIVDNPAIVLMAQRAGLDFVFYDCEHGVLSCEKLHDLMVLANSCSFASFVRVPQLSRSDVSRILDYGATGVMVPMIETREQAELLVSWSKYPPLGRRSYSGGANTHYGPSGNHEKNMEELNQRTMSIVQIETVRGVENIDLILEVEGIDAAIVGPCDLGISMGNPDNVMDEREISMIARTAEACKRHGKAFGIIGSMELVGVFQKEADILVSAIDTDILRSGLVRAAEEYRKLEE